MTAFTIKQEKYEGPLDLLLTLIERRQLHIGDITLSKVTDDFLNYAKSFVDFPLAESAQFAYIASTLLLIKSKALLPQLSLSREEEESIEDLQNRLKLLQRFRELSRHVKTRFGESPLYLPQERKVVPVFAPPKEMTSLLMFSSVKAVLAAIPKVEALAKVAVKKVLSLEQMIGNLRERITSALRMSFKDFAGAHKAERVNVIVGFLAMLELVKDGLLFATQDEPHGDIMMETGEVSTPRY
ncbi:MAG: ScpA family protein [bacterium]|nr:ScpA family protein [bacterium]